MDFYAFRKERAFSKLERFHHGRAAASVAPEVPPKSHLGKAVGYLFLEWLEENRSVSGTFLH
ncbi:MAG: hypothetical protein WHS46_09295, partial [Desulfosoma sp.]